MVIEAYEAVVQRAAKTTQRQMVPGLCVSESISARSSRPGTEETTESKVIMESARLNWLGHRPEVGASVEGIELLCRLG
jgi:hypothetical protein